MLDLRSLPQRYLNELGADKVAEITGASKSVMAMWISRDKFPLEAVQKLLEFDATPIHEIKPLYTVAEKPTRLAMLLCTNRPVASATYDTLLAMKGPEMQFRRFNFNSIYHVRNMAAAWFLNKSKCEWAHFGDDDMIHPCGDAELFKALMAEYAASSTPYPDVFAAAHSIYRLRYHEKKMIGACYFGRKQGVPAQFAGGAGLKELLRRGPRNEIRPVDWIGFGSILIHRDVFTDIIKTQGEKIKVTNEQIRKNLGYDYSFFMPINQDAGDDISFCARAREAGHQPFVDLSLMPAHVGQKGFTFLDQ